jgi:hypothetical protein
MDRPPLRQWADRPGGRRGNKHRPEARPRLRLIAARWGCERTPFYR